jgi:hypothetical protein
MSRRLFALLLAGSLAGLLFSAEPLSPVEKSLVDTVSVNTLKAHVSFLASDLLEGRDTPSRGLDIAAEYIASEFRRLGLEPAGNDGYFQTAPFAVVKQPMDGFELTLEPGGKAVPAAAARSRVQASAAAELTKIEVVRVDPEKAEVNVAGKAALLVWPNLSGASAEERQRRFRALSQARQTLAQAKAAVIVVAGAPVFGGGGQRLVDLSSPRDSVPIITTNDTEFTKAAEVLKPGPAEATLSVKIPAPVEDKVTLKNVVAVLRGSDPVLKDTCILLSGHYDHIGISPRGEGDRINNGANDDASGTATVLQLAEAFVKAPERPKRTLVFALWFGEEEGLLGSTYYAHHAEFPLAKTVAMLNFEHMGRTDDNEGDRTGMLSLTGFDYTDIADLLKPAAQAVGVKLWKHEKNSDPFFSRSDNQAFADAGIPAHAVLASYIFPDYHRPGDEWQKINYENMANLDRALAVGILRIADNPEPPKWKESNPKTERYVQAWRKLTGASSH